ncbi:unnamed protein product, partial [marine sediment metagenome]
MAKKKFEIIIRGRTVIELDEKVIDAVDDEWRAQMYNLHTPEEIAGHIAYNLVLHKIRLTMVDGWANQDDSYAEVLEEE